MFVYRTEMEELKLHNSHLESEVYDLKLKLRKADEINEVLENELIAIKRELEAARKPKCDHGYWCTACKFCEMIERDSCGRPLFSCTKDIPCTEFARRQTGR